MEDLEKPEQDNPGTKNTEQAWKNAYQTLYILCALMTAGLIFIIFSIELLAGNLRLNSVFLSFSYLKSTFLDKRNFTRILSKIDRKFALVV